MSDERWKGLAENSRRALNLLGYLVEPQCMPGESNPCGGTYAEHFTANLAALKAVADHHLAHIGPAFVAPIFGPVYDSVADNLAADCDAGHSGGKDAKADT